MSLTYFAQHGTKRIKFTGGEPFIYHGLLRLVEECRALGMQPTIVTNGTSLPTNCLECLRANAARVKVSLHGPRKIHDMLQGQHVYDTILSTIRSLITAGIETSVHTLLYRGSDIDLTEWIKFLSGLGVHKVSFMTFVPRGRGARFKDRWSFTESELETLSHQIEALAEQFRDSIIVRCLDFARKPYIVFETDGSVSWQFSDESADEHLFWLSSRFGSDHYVNSSGLNEITHQ